MTLRSLGAVLVSALVSAALVVGGVSAPAFAEDPTPTPTPTSAPAAATVDLSGGVVTLADRPNSGGGSVSLFRVTGQGYLLVDFAAVPADQAGAASGSWRFAVPDGVDVGTTMQSAVSALRAYSSETGIPISAVAFTPAAAAPPSAAIVTLTPATAAVHKIFAVVVTPANDPSNSVDPSQSVANIQADVANADAYWRAQSNNKVAFELAGVSTWYKSSQGCFPEVDWNFFLFLIEATEVAYNELGYREAFNNHLLMVFPSGTDCSNGGTNVLGAATLGGSLNSGGALWVRGTGGDTAIGENAVTERGTLIHQLGHNLSLGDGNLRVCNFATTPDASPGWYPFDSACPKYERGDLADGMGDGVVGGLAPGSLSSPAAIRSGIWPSTAYANAPPGQSTWTLNAVSTNTGRRAIILENWETSYYIEFRNGSAGDAPYAGTGCVTTAAPPDATCGLGSPGVRILRIGQPRDGAGYKGFTGDGSELIARESLGTVTANYGVGQSFQVDGAQVQVTAINGNVATVVITKQPEDIVGWGHLAIVCTLCEVPDDLWDGELTDVEYHVGDTLTAMLSKFWFGTPHTIQWYRNNVPITGATGLNYVLTAADLGKYIKVSGCSPIPGGCQYVEYDPSPYTGLMGWSAVLPGTIVEGTVAINAATLPFTPSMASWFTAGVTYNYEWLRDGVAIPGATLATYAPVAADNGTLLSLRVTAKKPGYTDVVVTTDDAKDYTLASTGSLAISGSAAVGQQLSLNALSYSTTEGPVTPTVTYAWYRSGVVIPGANASTYTLAAADLGKVITASAFARLTGFAGNTATAPATAAVIRGDIAGSYAAPVVTENNATLTLTVGLPGGSVTESGVAFIYQWYRDGVAVAGATAATYQLAAADYGKPVSARVIVTKLNYNSAALYSAAVNYSVTATGSLVVVGAAQVGLTVSASALTYSTTAGPVSPVLAYQWLRNGVVIAGATASAYALVAADFGTVLSVRVTATEPGFLVHVATSTAAPLAVKGVLSGDLSVPVVSKSGSLLLTAALPGTSVTDPGVALAYQWLRDGVAIAGATAATFQLTGADYNKAISARVTVSKLNFTSVVLTSAPENYSVTATGALTVDGTLQVGLTVSASALSYATAGGAVSPALAYVWYRNGVVIAGATGSTYAVVAADFGTKLSVRVAAVEPGFLAHVSTSPQTGLVVKGVLSGDLSLPVVSKNPTTLLLTAALPGTSVTDLGTATAYQWLRNGVAIPLATATTFQLTAADYNKAISVRVTVSKLNFTSVVLTSAVSNESVLVVGAVPVFTGMVALGGTLTLDDRVFTAGGDPVVPAMSYQWLRDGLVIAGATSTSYTAVAADLGKSISVRVTAAEPGYLPSVSTSVGTQKVGASALTGWDLPVTVTQAGTSLVLTMVPGVTGATLYERQWYRDGVAIAGATSAMYTLTGADVGKAIVARVVSSKPGFTTVVTYSAPINYSVAAAGSLTVIGTAQVGLTVSASSLTYSTSPVLSYQWLRNGVAIAGATASSYPVVAADFGTALSVRVTAAEPGFLSSIVTSAAASTVRGVLSGDLSVPVVSKSGSLLLTAALPGSSVTDPGAAIAYQWLRDGVAIAGATAATFQLTAADYNKNIAVRVTVSKLNYTSVVLTSATANYSATATGALSVLGTLQVGLTLSATALAYSTSDGPVTPVLSYAWLRSGVLIAGATASTYPLVAADLAAKISVRVTATEPGFIASVVTSPQTATTVVKGVLSGDLSVPVVTKSGSLLLTAALPGSSVTDPGVALAYQWLRDGVAVAGATAATFQLTAADYNKNISVRVTASKLNYNSVVLASSAENYSVIPSALVPVFTGAVAQGQTLTLVARTFTADGDPVTPVPTYQWLRDGVSIPLATNDSYTAVAADLGKSISARVTAAEPGFLPSVSTSVGTQKVAANALTGWDLPVTVTQAGTSLALTVVPGVTGATLYERQWYRDGVAISGATAATYTLTSADVGKAIAARVVSSKPGFTTVVTYSAPINYTVAAAGSLTVVGTAQVGLTVSATSLTYSTSAGPVSPVLSYQWLRNGLAIAGATASSYPVVAADFGTKLSVRVAAVQSGFLTSFMTSPQIAGTVVKGVLSGDLSVPVVTKSGSLLLTAALPGTSVTDPGVTLAYQWLRDGVAIVGATAATFQLTAADYNKNIAVRVTVSKLNYTSVVLTSVPENYSVISAGSLLISGTAQVGLTLSTSSLTYSTSAGPISPVLAYQWLRNGAVIAGATASTYVLVAADFATKLSVRVTATEPGFLASVVTSPVTGTVVVGVLSGDRAAPTVTKDPVTMKLTVALTAGSVIDPGIAIAYQWYRNGIAISGGTAATYTLTGADYGQELVGRLVVTKLNYTMVVLYAPTVIP